MIFIGGLSDRQKEVSSGSFTCPHCGVPRPYKLMKSGRYFSLYFIPLFRTKDLGEYVQCQVCQRMFDPQVLSYKGPSASERLVQDIRKELQTGMPLHMMVEKLVNQKMDRNTAELYVKQAAAGETVTCAQCKFVYLHGVERCLNCGSTLHGE
jgi:hypothetical protein